MLELAAPFGLVALGALLAPVLIHLVRRPLRVVRVGSLRWMQGDRRQVRSLRWHERLLLALRCTLVAMLGLSLAGLRWQSRTPEPARWLLFVSGANFDAAARAEWDRLRTEGFEARALSPDFPKVDSANAPRAAEAEIDAWSLLREADFRLPAGSRVVVFGPTWATLFRGARPVLANIDVSWRATTGEPSVRTNPAAVRIGLVAASDRAEDVRYLRAAFAAIGSTIVTDDVPEWIFQLGDVALPPAWNEAVKGGARLVTDAPNAASIAGVARWLEMGASGVHLRQRVAVEAGVPVWRDSAGEAVLTEEHQGAGLHWRFALRFHPDWTDWPLTSGFPQWWRTHLRPMPEAGLTLAPEQAAPQFAAAKPPAPPALAGFGRFDLRGWCWGLGAILFVVERALSLWAQRRRVIA